MTATQLHPRKYYVSLFVRVVWLPKYHSITLCGLAVLSSADASAGMEAQLLSRAERQTHWRRNRHHHNSSDCISRKCDVRIAMSLVNKTWVIYCLYVEEPAEEEEEEERGGREVEPDLRMKRWDSEEAGRHSSSLKRQQCRVHRQRSCKRETAVLIQSKRKEQTSSTLLWKSLDAWWQLEGPKLSTTLYLNLLIWYIWLWVWHFVLFVSRCLDLEECY